MSVKEFEPSVTLAVNVRVTSTIGTVAALISSMHYVAIVDVSTSYSMFRLAMIDYGIELPPEGYYRLYQIILEIVIIDMQDSSDAQRPNACSDNICPNTKKLIALEVSREVGSGHHARYLSEFSNDADTVHETMAIAADAGVYLAYNACDTDGYIKIPLQWERSADSVFVHLAASL